MYNLFHSPSQMITVGDYGSDDDAHQGDAGKAAIQRDKDADSNKDGMT